MPLFLKQYLLIFFILFSVLLQSQTKEEVQKLHTDFKQLYHTNFEKAHQNATQSLTFSKQLADSTLLLYSYQNLSKILYLQGKNKAAKDTLSKSIALAKTLKREAVLSNLYNTLGSVEKENNNSTIALRHYEDALEFAKKHELSKEILSINNNLARLYADLEDDENAQKILRANIIDAQTNKDTILLAEVYNILGTIEQEDIDSALYFFNKALGLSKQIKNKYLQGVITSNLGDVYIYKEGEEFKALPRLQESEKMSTQVGDNVTLYHINFSLGVYYERNNNLKEADKKYRKAIDVYGSFVDDFKKADALFGVSGIYEHLGRYKVANDYLKEHIYLKDSILSLRKKTEFEEIRTQYEVDKKNAEILLYEKEKKISDQERRILIISTLLLLILIISLVLFYRHRIKVQKIIEKHKEQLFKKEKEALEREQEFKRIQGSIEGQEKEKNRISRELHDGIGGKLTGIRHLLQASDIPNSKTENIANNLSSVASEIRTLSHHLSSHYIINTPFENLLTDLKNQYTYSQTFNIDINVFPQDCFDTLNQKIKHHLYRILQELLNNIVHHAKANHISISFVRHKNNYACTVEDDGIGFDSEQQQDGIGLINIKERIRNLNGTIEIHSLKNKGTTIVFEIPCE